MTLPDDVELRPAGRADEPALNALIAACDASYRDWTPTGWEPPDPATALNRWHGALTNGTRWTRMALEPGGRAVGLVCFSQALADLPDGTRSAEPIPGRAHVSAVFVHPDRWREGIAAGLLGLAEQAMRDAGYREAQLWTPEHAPARRFYEAMGWRHDGRTLWMADMALPLVAYLKAL